MAEYVSTDKHTCNFFFSQTSKIKSQSTKTYTERLKIDRKWREKRNK